tara:strand:- start:1777 stop:2997 length:1221 start_codon:yes stop_codon:yes gene_type:complete
MNQKKVCVVGLGYIGLPTATILANTGYYVHGVDIDESVINKLNAGEIHIIEPDLDILLKKVVDDGNFKAHLGPCNADVFMICVPTPFKKNKNNNYPAPDITYVLDAAKSISPFLKEGNLVILESTSPVGTTEQVKKIFESNGVDTNSIFISYCPERVLPGNILSELIMNNRIVGGLSPKSTIATSSFYKTFVKGDVVETDANTAEMCKLTENSYRDLNIAFANELSIICEKENLDVWKLIKLANLHPRVDILQPGAGVGGHCIAVDPWFIVDRNPEESRLIKLAREVNLDKTKWVIKKVKEKVSELNNELKRKPKIACLGLSFKPNIDDLRESPALEIAYELQKDGHNIFVVEPNILNHNDFELIEIEDALTTCDIFVVLVKHDQFLEFNNNDKFKNLHVLNFCGL